jgi:hypothetical protein
LLKDFVVTDKEKPQTILALPLKIIFMINSISPCC